MRFKQIDLIVVALFNCSNKENLIFKLTLLDEIVQSEIMKIVEIYMLIESTPRDSITSIRVMRCIIIVFNKRHYYGCSRKFGSK